VTFMSNGQCNLKSKYQRRQNQRANQKRRGEKQV
jgi:hypothetical protein